MAIPNPGTLQLKVHKDSVLRLWITCWEERKIVVLQVAKIPSRVQKKKGKMKSSTLRASVVGFNDAIGGNGW